MYIQPFIEAPCPSIYNWWRGPPCINPILFWGNSSDTTPPTSKGKVGYPWVPSTRDIYQHIPPIYGLYNGFMGQYGVMFWEQLLGYLPKGTQNFPLTTLPTISPFITGRGYNNSIYNGSFLRRPILVEKGSVDSKWLSSVPLLPLQRLYSQQPWRPGWVQTMSLEHCFKDVA